MIPCIRNLDPVVGIGFGNGGEVVRHRGIAVAAAASTVYVDAAWAGSTPDESVSDSHGTHTFDIDAFATIEDGVTFVASGGNVIVDAGTYAENINVTQPVNLEGPEAGQNANTRSAAFVDGKANPAIEAVITAPTVDPEGNLGAPYDDLIRVSANDVTIDGFVLDGNNAALDQTHAVLVNGVDVDARRGIDNIDATGTPDTISDLQIEDNVIQNFGDRGISLFNNGAAPAVNNLIEGNLVQNVANNSVLLLDNAYTDVIGNTIIAPDNSIGLALQNFYVDGSMTWSGNTVTVGDAGIGIHVNLFYASTGSLNITDNTVNAAADAIGDTGLTWGINVWSVQVGSTVTLTDNTIGATNNGGVFDRGMNFWDLPTTNTISVSGGSVADSTVGVEVESVDPYFGPGANTTVNISNVDIDAQSDGVVVNDQLLSNTNKLYYGPSQNVIQGDVSANLTGDSIVAGNTGVLVESQPGYSFTAAATIQGDTTISDAAVGIDVDGADASLAFVGAGAASLSNISGNYITLASGAQVGQTIDATNVSFDGTLGSALTLQTTPSGFAVEDKIADYLDNPTLGYVQINSGNVFVTQLSDTTTNGAIQRGVNVATSGNTVYVQAGTYVGANVDDSMDGVVAAVSIDKPLTLVGPNAAFDPNSNTTPTDPQAVIEPGSSDPNLDATESVGIEVTSSDVTIEGLTVSGSNPNLPHVGGVSLDGVPIDEAEGIVSYRGVGGITLQGNLIQDTDYSGVDFYNADTHGVATSGNTIDNNLIQNLSDALGFGVGVLLYNNFYAQVSQNVISNATVGIQTGNFSQANPGAAIDQSISNNTISATGVGIFFNLMYDATSNFTVANNSITAINSPADAPWEGVLLTSIQSAVGVTFQDNTIDGSNAYTSGADPSSGYEVWNTPTTGSVLISGGNVSGVDYGVWVNTFEAFDGDADATQVTISGASIIASQIGVYVEDSPQNASHPAASALIVGNTNITATGSGIGIEVSGSKASLAFSATTPATINVGTGNYITLANGALGGANPTILNASQVSFGGFVGANGLLPADLATYYGIEDKITDYLDNPTLGYVQLNSGNVFVTQLSDTTTNGAISRGVNVTQNGNTLYVQSGSFFDNLVIPTAITLVGAGQGNTIIYPAVSDPDSGTSINPSTVIVVQSSNVTIEGLTINGANPNLAAQGVLVGGALINANTGIVTDYNTGDYTNLNVNHVTVENVFRRGIEASFDALPNDTFDIENDTVTNVQGDSSSIAIFNYAESGVFAYDNVSYANDAISANFSDGTTFHNNTITNSGSGIHTDNAGEFGTNDSIYDNNVSLGQTDAYGIFVFAPYSPVSVHDNTISGQAVGLAVFGSQGATAPLITFTNNSVDATGVAGATGAYVTTSLLGFGFTDASASFVDNTFTNNSTGIYIETAAGSGAGITPSASISGGSISGSVTGVDVQGGTASITGVNFDGSPNTTDLLIESGAGTVTLGDDQFFGSTYINNQSPNYVDATGHNQFDGVDSSTLTSSPADLATAYGIEDKITDGIDQAGLGLVRINTGNLYVSQLSETTNAGAIQRAVNLSSPDDTIHVQAGTFVGQVSITQDLSLIGAGQGQTTIEPSTPLLRQFSTGSGAKYPIIYANSNSVTIQGLTVDGQSAGNAYGDGFLGIAFYNAGGLVDHVTIENIENDPFNGVQDGVALYADNADSMPRGLTVTNDDIFNYQKNGMALFGTGLTVDVEDNTVTGAGATTQIAQNGIELGFGAGGAINDNIVSGDSYTGSQPTDSTGILLYATGSPATISGDSVSGSDVGVYAYSTVGTTDITGDSITGSPAAAIQVGDGNFDISDNTLTGGASDHVNGNTGDGIDLLASDISGTTIQNNLIQNNTGDGVSIGNITDSSSPLTINNNAISGNATAGIDNESTVAVDATNNWWGSVSGPTAAGNTFNVGSQGDKIVGPGTTTYVPWLNSGNNSATIGFVPTGTSFAPVTNNLGGQFSSIQAGINGTPGGANTVFATTGTFTESPQITESLTVTGAGEGLTSIDLLPAGSPGTAYLSSLYIAAPGGTVTVEGFTIVGNDAVGAGLANSDILLEADGLNVVNIENNQIESGQVGSGANGDDGMGILTTSTLTPAQFVGTLNVSNNTFLPTDASGSSRAYYINSGTDNFNFTDNTITGDYGSDAITEANNALIQGNTITGAGAAGSRSPGLGAFGDTDPTTYGHATFIDNTFNNVGWGVALYSADDAIVENNLFTNDDLGVWLNNSFAPGSDPSTDTIQNNSFDTSNTTGVENDTGVTVNGTSNWWGSTNGPAGTVNSFNMGSQGSGVLGAVNVAPWLTSGHNNVALGSPGFVPDAGVTFAPVTNDEGGEFSSIGAAVIGTDSGHTITAVAGTFTEEVSITKPLTILGAQANVNPGSAGRGSSESIIMGLGTNAPVIVNSGVNNVTINGFTIQSPVTGSGAYNAGIYINGSTGINIEFDILQDNTVGVAIANAGGSITDDLIQNNNAPGAGGGNGIEFFAGSTPAWAISNNYFTGNLGADVLAATGDTSPTVFNLAISDNQMVDSGGIDLFNTGNSNIIANQLSGIAVAAVYLGGADNNIDIAQNTISDNSGAAAVEADNFYGFGPNSGITVQNNFLDANGWGVLITSGALTGSMTVNINHIAGNTTAGLENDSITTVNAQNNWWGSANGPSTPLNPYVTTGDAVVGSDVIITPWLGDGIDSEPFVAGFQHAKGANIPLVVNTLTDPATPTPGILSLREAVSDADLLGNDQTISFLSGLSGTINLTSQLPAISANLAINGPGISVISVTAPGPASVITIDSGVTAIIKNITLVSSSAAQNGLNIIPGGTLDISNGNLALDYVGSASPLATIQSELDAGYNGGSWNYPGIISSSAVVNPAYAVAYADGSKDIGTPAQPNQVLLKYDLIGDINLDGTVNLTDLLALLNSYGQSGKDWAHGDLNYDGTVNLTDLLELLNNYGGVSSNTSLAQPPASNSGNSVLPAAAIVAPATSTPIATAVKTVSPGSSNPNPTAATTLFSNVPITTDSDILGGNTFQLASA